MLRPLRQRPDSTIMAVGHVAPSSRSTQIQAQHVAGRPDVTDGKWQLKSTYTARSVPVDA